VKLTTHLRLVPRVGMNRAVPLRSLCSFMALDRDNFTFIFIISWNMSLEFLNWSYVARQDLVVGLTCRLNISDSGIGGLLFHNLVQFVR
jgi:hypothetical protein